MPFRQSTALKLGPVDRRGAVNHPQTAKSSRFRLGPSPPPLATGIIPTMSTAATPSRRARPKAVGFGIQAGVRAHQRAIEISALMLVAALAGFLFLSRESLWLDEAYSVTLAGSGWGTIWQRLSFSEANGSPYYILLHFWLVLGKSEFAVRSLSVL